MAESCGMAYWITQAERFLDTDMSVKEWCGHIGRHPSAMNRWMVKIAAERPDVFGGPGNISQPGVSGWIKRTRENIRASRAIQAAAPRGFVPISLAEEAEPAPAHVPAPAPDAMPASPSRAPIAVRVNGAEVLVPAGSDPADVGAVLRAVASL
ncbi:MAG: hypothetical protein ACI4OC_01315 [Coriobacteriales bacterium]